MKGQIIPMNHDAVIDDEIIRLANANHERFVRARREQQEREEAERQARAERRCYIANQVLARLICAVTGAGAALGILILICAVTGASAALGILILICVVAGAGAALGILVLML